MKWVIISLCFVSTLCQEQETIRKSASKARSTNPHSHSAWIDSLNENDIPNLDQQWQKTSSSFVQKLPARTLHLSGLHDPIGSVQGLVSRLLGNEYVSSFSFSVIDKDPSSGNDVFELDYDSTGKTVIVRGSAGYAISSGLNWYLKYTANCSFTWGRNGSGNQISLLPQPNSLIPPTPLRMVSAVAWRYAYNVCTYGYSMPFWNFTQFEEEIDRLALWGVNIPLAFQGQEYVWHRFYVSLGLSETEINAFLAGPAFLPWNRMGNMQAWGGPLNDNWYNSQKTLQISILSRMREFGMIPVLPGFAGHVPGALKTHYPNATFTQSPDWCGFEPQYGSDTLLEAIDPLFTKIGSQFNSYVLADFGDPTGKETPIFNADMYNEMEPNSADPSYLAASNAAIYQAMISVNPNSIYLMQAWLFHEDFWNYDRVKAFLSGVPTGGMIILDLNSEEGPVWNEYDSFFNHSWVWCSLITYGGRRGIYGDLNRLALSPYVDLNASATLHGIGFTPEATEMIPSQFDIAMEAGWRSVPISDPIDWMKQWGVRRYGSLSPSLATAQEILSIAAYNSDIDTASLEGYPSVGDSMSHNTNATGIFNALQLYVNAVENNEVVTTGPFNYDITDLSRQVLINYFSDLHTMLASRFARTNSSASVYSIISAINTLFISLDSVLSADINYLLGTWIQDAASWGNGDEDWTNLLVFNARNQITLWGPRGEINDYAAKNGWADLVSSYYFPRWTILFDAMKNSSSTGIPINQASVDANITSFELYWGLQTTDRPKTTPSGIEPITLATQLVQEYFKFDATLWTVLPNTMISLPPKSTQFVNIGSVGQAAVSGDCPFTNHGDGSSLVNCQANCLTAPDRCNAINYSPSNKDCVWRMCSDPLHPILSPGYGDYSYYGLNETASSKIMTSWHTDIGILSQLCLSDPACNGFASDGSVITDVSRTLPMSGVNLYVRN